MARDDRNLAEEARRVLALAEDEARLLRSPVLQPEHLLLALIRDEECIAGSILAQVNLRLDVARTTVAEAVGRRIRAVSGDIPRSAETEDTIAWAHDTAERLGVPAVDTQHLLIGLLHNPFVRQILLTLGYTKGEITRRVNDAVMRAAMVAETGPLPDGAEVRVWGAVAEIGRLTALAASQGCSIDSLVWEAVRRYAERGHEEIPLTYSDRARRVFRLAREEAKRRNHASVEPDHLLVGLAGIEDGLASALLKQVNVNLLMLVAADDHWSERNNTSTSADVPFDRHTNYVLVTCSRVQRR